MQTEEKKSATHCNGCANHCPITAMQCARGLKIMGMNKSDGQEHNESRKTSAGLGPLLRSCSNKLFISGAGEEYFDVLDQEEKENLRAYLSRLAEQ